MVHNIDHNLSFNSYLSAEILDMRLKRLNQFSCVLISIRKIIKKLYS